jgi:hypothetical protein
MLWLMLPGRPSPLGDVTTKTWNMAACCGWCWKGVHWPEQGSMSVNEYLNSFIQLSRYSPDEKKQDMFLNGLNDDIQFQLLNIDYADFQHMINNAIVIENKIKEMEKDGKQKSPFHG